MICRRNTALLTLLAAVLTLSMLAGCSAAESEPDVSEPDVPSETPAPDVQDSADGGEQPTAQFAWADIELTDVLTGETLRIADFSGKPVLVKTFAVW